MLPARIMRYVLLVEFLVTTVYSSLNSGNSILVVGSVNADMFIPVERLPEAGETIVAKESSNSDSVRAIAGGKGANTAVSCQRLGASTIFRCMLGDDEYGDMLQKVLADNQLDISLCERVDKPSGTGLVFIQDNGAVSAVVLGGANAAWPTDFDAMNLLQTIHSKQPLSCIMLQQEIPEWVNTQVAVAAAHLGIPVFQDAGGAERDISADHLKLCAYISPNLTELKRLTKLPVSASSTDEVIVNAARSLQSRGAHNVLVTLGERGSLCVTESGQVIRQPCLPVETVVDETGAGDNYRAGFCVAHFKENHDIQTSMAFGAAVGAVAVTKFGAIPSCPTRAEVTHALDAGKVVLNIRGGNVPPLLRGGSTPVEEEKFPFKFASRLNSMKDRADLWDGDKSVRGWILRQGLIRGLDLVDFNYPQHITSPVTEDAKNDILEALNEAKLQCGAICLRFPKEMQLGAYTNPDPVLRARAIELTKEACEWAASLGANEVVVWSAFDGYDYSLQVDYDVLYDQVVSAFQDVCDAHPHVKVSLEYKPTDENTRFFTVPSTGAACLLVRDVDRDNFGLTLDFGHCMMAGENPAQCVALVGKESRRLARQARLAGGGADGGGGVGGVEATTPTVNKLFGVQLGDGYGRLGAEDGLAFGSVHPTAALEFVLWLIKTDYKGHIYFDTFPRNEDPVREGEYNIRQFKGMYYRAKAMLEGGIDGYWKHHDAMGVLEDLVYRYLV